MQQFVGRNKKDRLMIGRGCNLKTNPDPLCDAQKWVVLRQNKIIVRKAYQMGQTFYIKAFIQR